jgi:hypothetical protein
MGTGEQFCSSINLIYEAVLDDTLWARALTALGDAMGAGQVALTALDHRATKFASIAPRTDPVMESRFQAYWAFKSHPAACGQKAALRRVFCRGSHFPARAMCHKILP